MQHFLNSFLCEIEIQYQEGIAALNAVANEKQNELQELWDYHKEQEEKSNNKIELNHFPQYKCLRGHGFGKENKGQDGNVINEKGGKMREEVTNKENETHLGKNGQVLLKRKVSSKINTRRLQVLKDTKNIPAKMFSQTKALDFIIHNAKPEKQWKAAKKQQKLKQQQKKLKNYQHYEYNQGNIEYEHHTNNPMQSPHHHHVSAHPSIKSSQYSKSQEHMYRSRSNTPHNMYDRIASPHHQNYVRYNNYSGMYHQQRSKHYKEVTPNRYRFKTPTYPTDQLYSQTHGKTPEENTMIRSVTPPEHHSNNPIYALNREKRSREVEKSNKDRRPPQKTRVTPPNGYVTPENSHKYSHHTPMSSEHYKVQNPNQVHPHQSPTNSVHSNYSHPESHHHHQHQHHRHHMAHSSSSSSSSQSRRHDKRGERLVSAWARDENLITLMKEQFERNVDPERIFGPAPEKCNLEEMFPSINKHQKI